MPAVAKRGPAPYIRAFANQQQVSLGFDDLDGEGVHAPLELRIERFHDRAVRGDAGHPVKPGGTDADAKVGFPALSIAPVTPVLLALVNHFKMAWGEFDRKFFCNLVANGHMDTGSVEAGQSHP